jgi:hypothetical protein
VKIVSPLLPYLPQRVPYRVVVMDRDLDEIVASQTRMLKRDQQQGGKLTDAQLKAFLHQTAIDLVAICLRRTESPPSS